MEGAEEATSTMRDIRREAGRSGWATSDVLEDRTSGGIRSATDKRGDGRLEILACLLTSTFSRISEAGGEL
jgi:hypothetical protein